MKSAFIMTKKTHSWWARPSRQPSANDTMIFIIIRQMAPPFCKFVLMQGLYPKTCLHPKQYLLFKISYCRNNNRTYWPRFNRSTHIIAEQFTPDIMPNEWYVLRMWQVSIKRAFTVSGTQFFTELCGIASKRFRRQNFYEWWQLESSWPGAQLHKQK